MSRTATPRSKSDGVYRQIRQRIIDGRYTPGYRLTLSTLAEEFGTSTVPVREAIRWLEAEGLVKSTHNKGSQVSQINMEEYTESMYSLAVLEAMATALSAPLLTEEQIEMAEAFNRRMEELTEATIFDSDAYRRLNGHFHSALCAACPNKRLLALVTTEAERVNIIRRSALSFERTWSAHSVRQHDILLDLIRRGAPAHEIESFAREHKLSSLRSKLGNGD